MKVQNAFRLLCVIRAPVEMNEPPLLCRSNEGGTAWNFPRPFADWGGVFYIYIRL
ncbi:MAG: hypothetical protein VB035_10250 [Candidatus Fimivivens sp.]|nr:hypothetical protein [Candidatus Fimivivens sp.]